MKIHGTKEGVDIGYSQRKNGGRQHTVFKENWSTGKMEPVQSKDNQAISFGGSADCPGQMIHVIRKKWYYGPFPCLFLSGL